MKFIITEDQRETILKKFWDKQVMSGKEPTLNKELLSSLDYPRHSNTPNILYIDYIGGYNVALDKAKKMLEDKKVFNTTDTDVNPGSYNFSFEFKNIYEDYHREITISVNVKFIGGSVNLGFVDGDEERGDEDIIDVLDNADMSDYFEIKEEIIDLMGEILTSYIRHKTGLSVIVNDVDF
jgi:hypothetical protein